MTFAHPLLLAAGVLAALLVVGLYLWARQARIQALARIGTPSIVAALAQHVPHRGRRTAIRATSALLLGVALAGPRMPGATHTVQADGLDLVIALDVSQSMLAEDVAPSRLQRARAELRRLVEALPGDRIGLVLFAGDAFIQCPLTSDHSAVHLFLDAAAPEMMPTQGTDFDAAVGAALDTFGPAPSVRPGAPAPAARVLLVVSDGEKHVGNVRRLRDALSEARVQAFTAGIGEAAGAPIPLYANGQRVGEKLDPETGAAVLTKLDPAALQALADDGGYLEINGGSGLDALPGQLEGLARAPLAVTDTASFREVFALPLALALVLLLLEPILTRGWTPTPRTSPSPRPVPVSPAPSPTPPATPAPTAPAPTGVAPPGAAPPARPARTPRRPSLPT